MVAAVQSDVSTQMTSFYRFANDVITCRVNERDKERFTSIKREQKRVISTLHIKRVMMSDIDKAFICIAKNPLGSTNETFKFRGELLPGC